VSMEDRTAAFHAKQGVVLLVQSSSRRALATGASGASHTYASPVSRLVLSMASLGILAVFGSGCGGGGVSADLSSLLHGHGSPNWAHVTQARGPVDDSAGRYAGIRLDDPVSRIRDQLGAPPPPERRPRPLDEIGGYPEFLPADTPTLPTYGDVSFSLKGGRVASILVWGKGARTLRGVGNGDSLATAAKAYPGIRCSHSYSNGEYVSTPRCEMKLGARRYLYFGGDPVFAIGLSTADFRDRGIGSK
jgi:hypothetical protein